jgi:hypothetical protein
LVLLLVSQGVGICEWREEAGYRWKPLTVAVTKRVGFTSLAPDWTGVTFSNRLSDQSIARNGVLSNGSGVALGDVDGDGRCDIYLCGLEGRNVLYRNLGEFRFEDVTEQAGVACDRQWSTGAVFGDVDGDGDLDLLVNALGGGTRLFLNDGGGRFTEKSECGLVRRFGSTTLALGDIDSDGDLDLYVANYRTRSHKDELPPIKIEARMVDGRLVVSPEDRFLAIGLRPGGAEIMEKGETDILYRNQGDGRFSAVSWTRGGFRDGRGESMREAPTGWGLSAMFRDLNGDGLPDLYVCNDFVYWPDEVWVNQGANYFQAVEPYAFRNTSMSSMAVDVADINRDGYDDVFVLEMLRRTHADRQRQRENRVRLDMRREMPLEDPEFRPEVARNAMFVNRGDGTYAEIAQLAGVEASDWSWSAAFLDVDLDGYEDLLIANGHNHDAQDFDTLQHLARSPSRDSVEARLENLRRFPPLHQANVLFRNRGDLTFEDVSVEWGFDTLGISQAMALADLDNDGDLDVVINNLHHFATIMRNDSDAPRLAVRLKGRPPNTRGIGARIGVHGGPVAQSQEIQCGGRYLSGDEALRAFAAGSMTNVMEVEILWRSGRRCRISGVSANRLLEIDEPSEDAMVKQPRIAAEVDAPWFTDVSARLRHRHADAVFDDLQRQRLLPRKLSGLGPGVGWIDVDGDGADDVVIGGGMGGQPAVYQNGGGGRFRKIGSGESQSGLTRDQGAVIAWPEGGKNVGVLVAMSNYEDALDRGPGVQRFEHTTGRWQNAIETAESSVGPLAAARLDVGMVLFVGGRVLPGRYPEPAKSRLYRWQDDGFRLDEASTERLKDVGMVSGAVWSELAGNGRADLVLACDWGPIRVFRVGATGLHEITRELGLEAYTGWWNGVATGDFDNDGRMDIVASNWGRNTKYQSHRLRELAVVFGDFAGNGIELLEAYYDAVTKQYVPWAALDIAAAAIPEIGQRFTTARSYGAASVDEILGDQAAAASRLTVNTLESALFLNRGGRFEMIPLPVEAQFAPAFGLAVADFDGDGAEDLFLSQNFFGVEPETSRYDAGRGLWLRGDGRGGFQAVPGQESGIRVYGEQRGCAVGDFDGDARTDLIVAQNNHETRLYRNARAAPGLRVRFGDGAAAGIGATLRLRFGERFGPAREVQAGSGYWSQNSLTPVLAAPAPPSELWVRWPGGRETRHPVPDGARELVVRR